MEKNENPVEGSPVNPVKDTGKKRRGELKTDFPLSEKDELKQAEEKMRKRRIGKL